MQLVDYDDVYQHLIYILILVINNMNILYLPKARTNSSLGFNSVSNCSCGGVIIAWCNRSCAVRYIAMNGLHSCNIASSCCKSETFNSDGNGIPPSDICNWVTASCGSYKNS